MKYGKIMKIIAVATGVTLLGATITGCVVGKDTYNDKVEELQQNQELLQDVQKQLEETQSDREILNSAVGELTNQSEQKDTQISQLNTSLEQYRLELDRKDKELLAYETSVATKTDLDTRSHTYDELSIGEEVVELVSDRELSGLFDGEVEFADEDFEAEEFLELTGLSITTNREDFGSNTYFSVPDEGIHYTVLFENILNTSEINDEDSLEFSFLGEDVEVTDWDEDSITFNRGTKYNLLDGQSVIVEGKNVTMITTGDNWVYVSVDGVNKKLWEGDAYRVNEIEIKAKEVMSAESWRGGVAVLELGSEVEETVEDGDEYTEDSVWEWSITPNSIGLILMEEYTDLDDDFKVLATGDSLCLPTDYLCVKYNGLAEEDYHDYDVDFDFKGDVQYVRIKGEFTHGLEDYDRIYLNGTTFLDEDMVPITDGFIALSDSDNFLVTDGTTLFFNMIGIPINLTMVFDGVEDISGRDEDYISAFGVKVGVPEDAIEDVEFHLSVPEEQVEGSIFVILRK